MRIGIVSDSHDRAGVLAAAIELLVARGIDALVHCGDVGAERCLDQLAAAGVPAHFVWGNMDAPTPRLERHAMDIGLSLPTVPLRVEIGGRRIAVCHGHERAFSHVLANGRVDYVLHGHTHTAKDTRIGRTRIINPGALHRASAPMCALLDLADGRLEFLEVSRP